MPVIYGSDSHDQIEGTTGADVMVGGAGSDTYVVNHSGDLVLEEADPSGHEGSAWWGTTAEEPITLIRDEAGVYLVRIQLAGAPDGVFTEFQLREVSPGVLGINGLRIADVAGEIPEVILAEGDSVWEYAFQLGRASEDDDDPSEVEFYGGGHGFQISQFLGLTLDGVDFTALPIGTPVNGSSLSVLQDLDILLPSDGVTQAGSVLLQHVFDASGLTVNHAHDYLDGFELANAYSAMLPLTGAGAGGIDWMQIGSGPAHQIEYDGDHYYEGGAPTVATAWGDDHNYLVTMTLPTGGPDVNGDWSGAGSSGMWLYDTAAEYSKIYVNWRAEGRYAAVDSAHRTHYGVTLRDVSLPTGATGMAPRAASQGVDTILASISLTLPDNIEILRLTGTDDLSGVGNRLNNTLIGNDGNNVLDGGGGEDLLYGGLGDDTYIVRSEDDFIEERANEGVDTILTLISGCTLKANLENLTFVGRGSFVASGNDLANRIEGNGGADTLRGMTGDDVLFGHASDDTLIGGAGDDHLVGGAGVNLLLGDEGDDVLDSRGGQGTLQGGIGDDIYYVDDRAISVFEAAGEGIDEVRTNSAIYVLSANIEGLSYTGELAFLGIGNSSDNRMAGGVAADQLNGEGGADVLSGMAGGDLLMGGEGDDTLVGGAGIDSLQGGTGVDSIDYRGAGSAVDVRLNLGVTRNDGDGASDTLHGVENVIGSAHNDTIVGSAETNRLAGGDGSDTLIGLGGNDILVGGAGALNTLQGGQGDDTYVLEAADSVIELAGEGIDTVLAHVGNVVLSAHVENLTFLGETAFTGTGNAGANVLTGAAGDDMLRGRGGADTLNGGAGSDTADYTLAAGAVTARIDRQQATNDGDGATDAFISIENLIGSNFNDLLIGDGGANVLMGGVGVDTLLGMGGDDVLWGGAAGGNNQLQGGAGDDYYVLESADTVVEFEGEGVDTVEARIASYVMRANVENLIFTGTTKFTATGNTLGNHITGGAKDDVFRGGGGDDTILGGDGRDELQLRGSAGQYAVMQDGVGWRIVDSVADRDGSTYVESIEQLRFLTGNTTLALVPAAAAGGKLTPPTTLPPEAAVALEKPMFEHHARIGDWSLTIDLPGAPMFDDWMF